MLAWEKASLLREIIMSDVPECVWRSDTICSNSFPLYDLDSNVNGYVFEFQNGLMPAGFIQIDLSSGVAQLDRYCFSGVHTAKVLAQNQRLSMADAQVVYLGGYSYLLKNTSQNCSTQSEYVHLYTGESVSLNSRELRAEYEQFVEQKSIAAKRVSVQPYATTTTKFVAGYQSIGWETYSSVGDSKRNTCAPIAVTNICKYWARCQGKTNLFPNTSYTYTTLRDKMRPYNNISMTDSSKVRPKWIEYVTQRGYGYASYVLPKNGTNNTVSFNDFKYFIDWNRPFLYQYGGHAAAAFGYQMIDAQTVAILADATSSTCIYLNWTNITHTVNPVSCSVIPL